MRERETICMKKRMGIIVLALLVTLLVAACATQTPAAVPENTEKVESAPSTKSEEPTEAPTAAPTEAPAVQYEITYKSANSFKDSIGTVYIIGIVGITNTGSKNLYIASGSFDFEDATGALIATEDYISAYPEVIQPGETSYMYTESLIDGDLPETVNVIPHEDVEEATVDCVRLPVSEATIKDDKYFGLEAMGRVENNTGSDASFVYVCAIMKDVEGNPVCIAFTIVDEIKAGDKVGFSMTTLSIPDSITADSIASFDVYAYPLQMQF